MPTRNIPTVFVIFGATGDLMGKKIVPSLLHLYRKGRLPKMFKIIGYSRRSMSQEEFQKYLIDLVKKHRDIGPLDSETKRFFSLFFYQQGDFQKEEDYVRLAKELGRIDGEWKVCSNKLFYLAVPPTFYETIFNHLHSSGLTIPCGPDEGWTRVIVEKPFGNNLQTARKLDLLLGRLFKEEQIYRIDHYLAKEMLQNILSFRFTNNLLEQSWNNKYIERIDIRLLERLGVEDRGSFYDGIGALRDVGQNHLLQMLAFVTMDNPTLFEATKIREKRAQVLSTLKIPTASQVRRRTFRGQYEGYRKIKGVTSDSQKETYFKVKLELTSPRWAGVPITIESGKRLKKAKKEIVVTFKHPSPCLCPPGSHNLNNKVVFSLEPKEEIRIDFVAKKPGLEMDVEERSFDFNYRRRGQTAQYVEEYEKLLLDCIEGNQVLFLSTKEVIATWQYIDPIIKEWEKSTVPLHIYKPDSTSVLKKAAFKPEEHEIPLLKKEIGMIGLGKMGTGIARQLLEKGWQVVGFNRTFSVTEVLANEGLTPAKNLKELVDKLPRPRLLWIMLPAGSIIDDIVFGRDTGLINYLDKGDIVVDAGNSFYQDAARRGITFKEKGIRFIDVGVSGGPAGARYGACLMVGGDKKTYEELLPLFTDISVPQGHQFFEGLGAGHFVKMVHNGIEYGMMQAIAEGFDVLKNSHFKLNLKKVADIYNHGSVVESRLVGWLRQALEIYGNDLADVSATVAHTGEGAWTVDTARLLKVKAKIIEGAVEFRMQSAKNLSYTGKVVSALRNQFGGHDISIKK